MLIVHFFARGIEKAKPDQLVSIYCQLEIFGRPRDVPFSTKLKCPSKYWNGRKVKPSFSLAEHINDELLSINKFLLDIWKALPIKFPYVKDFTYKHIRDYYFGYNNINDQVEAKTLLEVYDELVLSKDITVNTQKGYRTRKKNLIKWLNFIGNTELQITEIDNGTLLHFFSFLRQIGQSQNVANKHITTIRSVIEFSVDKKYLPYFPLGRANLSYKTPSEPKYLTKKLREKIHNIKIQSLKKVRDVAIFLIYTGFSYVDYCGLTSRNLIESNGKFCFKKIRTKTKIYSMPPLLPEAAEIINIYGSLEAMPRIQIDDYNKLLKILGELAGITEDTVGFNLTTSVFRETFSSMCENELMFSERAIMFFMGHTNPRQLNTYSKVQPARIFREMEHAERYYRTG